MRAIVRLRKTGAAVLALLLAVTGGAWTGEPFRAAGAAYTAEAVSTEYTENTAEAENTEYTADTVYIVKYKDSAAWLMEDSSAPFELADRAEMERLRDAGLLAWYEPDGEAELLDADFRPFAVWCGYTLCPPCADTRDVLVYGKL